MGHYGSLAHYGSFWLIPCFSSTENEKYF